MILFFNWLILFISPLSVLCLLSRFGVLWMRYTVVGITSCGGFSCQITLVQEGRILQKIHFKPPDQVRQPTFASDKTKPVTG
jgi:hypothetical protein